MRRLIALLALAVVPLSAEAQRHRAVRTPAPTCSFSVSIAYADPVPHAGMVAGRIVVTPAPASCASWDAFSPVDWIVVERGAAPNEISVTVTPNETSNPRTANLRIAGVEVPLTQLPRPDSPVIETALVKNGTFDRDLTSWGWQDRFPNGVGDVFWDAADANGSTGSGSMRLRSTALAGPGIQRLQCIANIEPGQVYEYRFAIRLGAATNGLSQTSVLDLDTPDCSGPYEVRFTEEIAGDAASSWQRRSATFRVRFEARSILIVLAGKTKTAAPFDVFFDDVSLTRP
jgi:hypothetical protein